MRRALGSTALLAILILPRGYPGTAVSLVFGRVEMSKIRVRYPPSGHLAFESSFSRAVVRQGVLHLIYDSGWLTQELGVEVVDEDLFDPCFGEAVLAIHGDELAPYALQLRQGHGRGWELDALLNILHCDLASPFSLVIFLVCHYLGEDVRGRLVEFVEVVLLRCRFLEDQLNP